MQPHMAHVSSGMHYISLGGKVDTGLFNLEVGAQKLDLERGTIRKRGSDLTKKCMSVVFLDMYP